jgi:3-oxoacyl-[acyl-carrier-protein] synthase-3
MKGARIISVGTALPPAIVTNHDLARHLDTNDNWITERTGIRERHIGGTTSALAAEAGRQALERAGLTGGDIDLLILATSTPDQPIPQTAAKVQHLLEVRGGALDISVGCSGFVYAMALGRGMILGGMTNVLVIGSETLSNRVDPTDRTTAVLFADGAGAVILSAAEEDALLASELGSNGALYDLLVRTEGGFIQMAGRDVYRHAVRICVESISRTCGAAGIEPKDIGLFVPHQANVRIIEAVIERLDMKRDRCAIVLDHTGNTSSASIPLALADAMSKGQVVSGDIVAFCGFGAGMAWGAQLWKWT